jgi:hypothetical protein
MVLKLWYYYYFEKKRQLINTSDEVGLQIYMKGIKWKKGVRSAYMVLSFSQIITVQI